MAIGQVFTWPLIQASQPGPGILSLMRDFSPSDCSDTSKFKIMMTFAQIFEQRRGTLDNGAYLRSKAPEVFSGTSLVLSEGLPTVPLSHGALLGIAFYSLSDLQLLDDVVLRSRNSSHSCIRVDVFDVLTCKSMQDFENIFPGLAPAYQTPLIGLWEGGRLVEKGWGLRETRRIVQSLFATPKVI
jgi:hypothetical protein